MITLREIERSDLARITAWRRDREVVDSLEGPPYFVASEVDNAWYDTYLTRRHRDIRCAICLTATDEHVGNVYLLNIDPVARCADFHIFVAREYWGKGLGKQGTRAMLVHGFEDRNIERIQLRVLADNARAIALYEGLGFEREGVHRRAAFKRGHHVDVVSMAVFAESLESGT